MSILNTFQYKKYLYILTLPKCNEFIYGPDWHNLQTRKKTLKEQLMVEKEVSVKAKTKNTFKHNYFPGFLLRLKNA